MMAPADRERLAAALSLGLGRQPLPPLSAIDGLDDVDRRARAALALVGQMIRLTPPPAVTAPASDWRLPEDAVPVLPDTPRDSLLRLVGRLEAASLPTMAPLLRAQIALAGYRPHPFDLPRLGPLLREPETWLGPVEQAWLDRAAREPATEQLTPQTWQHGSPAARLAFLRAQRRQDPAAARALLEAVFAAEPAKLRGDLLTALSDGLGPDDRPFLQSCANDRAATVKQVAESLLARLPGSPAQTARLDAACATLCVETTGLLRRRARLAFRPPAERGKPVPLAQVLDGLGCAALAERLGLTPEALPALINDDALRPALAASALRDRMTDLAAALLSQAEAPVWPRDVEETGAALRALPLTERAAFAAQVLRPDEQARLQIDGDWRRFALWLGAPLPPDGAARLLAARAWRDHIEKLAAGPADPDPLLMAVAALMPAALAQRFAETLAAIAPERLARTRLLVAFLADLAALPSPSFPRSQS